METAPRAHMLRAVTNLERRIATATQEDGLDVNQIQKSGARIKTNVVYGNVAQMLKGWRAFTDAYPLDRTADAELREAFYLFIENLPSLDGYNASKLAYVLDVACNAAPNYTIRGNDPTYEARIRNSVKALVQRLNTAIDGKNIAHIARINKAAVKNIRQFSNPVRFIETILSAADSPYQR